MDPTQPRKSEVKVELGNEKSNGAEEIYSGAYEQEREAESNEAPKPAGLGHDEDTFAADSNAFGQGRTTASHDKSGWVDPK